MKRIAFYIFIAIIFAYIFTGCGAYKGPSQEHMSKYLEAKEEYLKGDMKASLPLLDDVIARDKKFYQAAVLRGKVYYFTNQKEKARKDFETVLKQHPAHSEAELWLVRILQDNGAIDEAEARLQKMLHYDPQDPRLLYQLAQIYLAREDYKNALIALRQTALYREDFAKTFLELGRIYNIFNQKQEARGQLQYALDLLPEESILRSSITTLIEKIEQ